MPFPAERFNGYHFEKKQDNWDIKDFSYNIITDTFEACLYPEYETPPGHSSVRSHLATLQSHKTVHLAKRVHFYTHYVHKNSNFSNHHL